MVKLPTKEVNILKTVPIVFFVPLDWVLPMNLFAPVRLEPQTGNHEGAVSSGSVTTSEK